MSRENLQEVKVVDQKFLTIRQTAATGILSEHHLRMMEKQGRLPGVRSGNRFLVNTTLLIEQLDQESRDQAQRYKDTRAGATV